LKFETPSPFSTKKKKLAQNKTTGRLIYWQSEKKERERQSKRITAKGTNLQKKKMETLKGAIPNELKQAIRDSNVEDTLRDTCSSLHQFFLHFQPFHQVLLISLISTNP
jgi:hypothetical protein